VLELPHVAVGIAVPLSYQVYPYDPVPPEAVAVRTTFWSADIIADEGDSVGVPRTEYTVNVAASEVWFSGGFAFVVPVSTTFTVMSWVVPDADPVYVPAGIVQVFVVSAEQPVIAVPLSYQVYESVPVPPVTDAVSVTAWSADMTEDVWLIVGVPSGG